MSVSKKEISPCPIDATLSVIDGRWKGTILWRLVDGPLHTHELRRQIPGITDRMLIRHLQELTRDGILERTATGRRPSVTYALTGYGLSLLPVLSVVCDWGRIHLQRQTASSDGPREVDALSL